MPTPALLTVDAGNSRLKACLFEGDQLVAWGGWEQVADSGFPALLAWLGERPLAAAAIASVTAPGRTADLVSLLEGRVTGPLQAPPDSGLDLDVEFPETVGQDRIFAAVGALARVGGAALVVDAGTALTVDAVLYEDRERGAIPRRGAGPRPGRGIFLGGAIAPGPRLLARALAEGGAGLWDVDPRPGVPALGRHTAEALEAGIAVGFAGAAVELVRRLREETGLHEAPVVLTGGAGSFLSEVLPGALWVEHLVHEGLLARLRSEA